jgi:predicted dehydrogenase
MTLRVAVIGVGAMGRNHARVYWEMPDVELVGVADADAAQAEAIARKFNTRAFSDYREMLNETRPDAVTLSTPTSTHHEVALDVIRCGIHLLIENPIAHSIDESLAIMRAAEERHIKLMVGHIERFNPAVLALKQHIAAGDLGRVLQLDARRQGPYPSRISDVGVVIDLAVHDVDIMRFVSGQEVERVFAETQFQIHTDKEDLVAAVLRFSEGAVGTLNINWLTPTKIRELTVLGTNGLFVVNYLTQDLMFFKNSAITADWDTLHILRGVTEGEMIKYVFPRKEPLRAEQEAFLAIIQNDSPSPVSANDGMIALKLAQMMIEAGKQYQAVQLGVPAF